jgi:uncharacterized protein
MPDRLPRPHVVIAGVTTRPLAQSAARAGYRVTAVDAFGDLDLHAVADVILGHPQGPGQTYGPVEAAIAASTVPARLAAYTSNFENYPRAVARLSRGRQLLGNSPTTLARARDPLELMRILRRHSLPAPHSRATEPGGGAPPGRWLLKPRRSGGGHNVAPWSPGTPIPRSMYLQQRISGAPGSISFAADGVTTAVLGVSRQLVGDKRFGGGPFRYCGSLLWPLDSPLFSRQTRLIETAARIAAVLTRELGLVGLNGIDFIARSGVPYAIEVNPRYSASMELIERAHGVSLFGIHAKSCAGHMPEPLGCAGAVQGKAIVFARQDAVVSRSRLWMSRTWLADVPRPGEYIGQGRPICTVFAHARHPGRCQQLLARRARQVYRAMTLPGKRAA